MKKTAEKNLVISALILLLFCVLCGCGGKDGEKSAQSGGVCIVTTVFPQYDFARKITAGTDADITMLIKPGSEAHSYDPTPADMVKISGCDLFVEVGGESEAWAEKVISAAALDTSKVLSLMETVSLLCEEEGIEHEEHSHGDDGEEEEYDEHVWTSPKNAIIIVKEMTERISALDRENEKVYRENAEAYLEELSRLDADFDSLGKKAEGKTLIFGDRFPFLYLARAYGFEYRSAFSGCSAQTEASVATVCTLIDLAKEADAKVIFAVDFSNGKIAQTIASEVGAKVSYLYSCHNIAASDMEKGVGYLELMRQNLDRIAEALE